MGNAMICKPGKDLSGGVVSRNKKVSRSQRRTKEEEQQIQRQALAIAIHQHQLSQRSEGSMSRRIGGSSSSRWRNMSNSFSNAKHEQVDVSLDNIETKKIVLVHGEGFGAWCWYKIIPLMEEAGLDPVALDLNGSGINSKSINHIASLAEYSKPLIEYFSLLRENEKVILVGHSCGGASLSYAMECHPEKISKAVFICATMVSNGQKPFDVFAQEVSSTDVLMQDSRFLLYGNGEDKPPTGFMFNKQQMKELYFNQTPTKDIVLSSLSMRPAPLAPVMEGLTLTSEKYGAVRRYFVQTLEDRLMSPDAQEKMVQGNPPSGVYKIKGGDHSPFFSKPQSLHKILLEIARLPAQNP